MIICKIREAQSDRQSMVSTVKIFKIFDSLIFVLEPREPFRIDADMISSRSGPVAPLGMVWSPSYEGFCDFVVPVFCFSSKTHTSWLSFAF